MLLVIDVGNTNTVIGIFKDENLIKDWRIPAKRNTTVDEFYILAKSLFAESGIDPKAIKSTIISCVVPPIVPILDAFCRRYIGGGAPHWVNAETVKDAMPILYTNPKEVGADRIVNSVAAYHRYPGALIAIDFGTATTFDVISENGEYLGGAIAPGIATASDALFRRASKLPRVELFDPPPNVIGKDTESSLKSGIIYGYAAMVDGMVDKIAAELPVRPKVVATGGLAPLMKDVSRSIEIVDGALTLEGLRLLSKRI